MRAKLFSTTHTQCQPFCEESSRAAPRRSAWMEGVSVRVEMGVGLQPVSMCRHPSFLIHVVVERVTGICAKRRGSQRELTSTTTTTTTSTKGRQTGMQAEVYSTSWQSWAGFSYICKRGT